MPSSCTLAHDTGCVACGKALTGKQKKYCSKQCNWWYRANHMFTRAKDKLRKAEAWYYCAQCGTLSQDVHVDHINPAKGQHGRWSCIHHIDNLRILCIPCHKAHTRQQHQSGEFK